MESHVKVAQWFRSNGLKLKAKKSVGDSDMKLEFPINSTLFNL